MEKEHKLLLKMSGLHVKTGSGGTLNTLFSRPSANGASFGGIRIDGSILIDAQS